MILMCVCMYNSNDNNEIVLMKMCVMIIIIIMKVIILMNIIIMKIIIMK